MKDINPTIIATFITAICSLTIALISLFGNRRSENKKLWLIIKNQEFQNRLIALNYAIEIIQKIKDELRNITVDLEGNRKRDFSNSFEKLSNLENSFSFSYASLLGSLTIEEAKILHEMKKYFMLLRSLNESLDSTGFSKRRDIVQKYNNIRDTFTVFQMEYKDLRTRILQDMR